VNPYIPEDLTITLRPSPNEIDLMVKTASKLIREKVDRWVLEQIPDEQLKILIKQFEEELYRRGSK